MVNDAERPRRSRAEPRYVEESNSIVKSESNSQISAASSPGYSPSKMTRSSTRNATTSDKNSTRKSSRKKCFDPYSNAGDSTEDDTNEAHYATRTRRAGRKGFKSSDSAEKRSAEKSSRAKRSCRLNNVKNEASDDEMEEEEQFIKRSSRRSDKVLHSESTTTTRKNNDATSHQNNSSYTENSNADSRYPSRRNNEQLNNNENNTELNCSTPKSQKSRNSRNSNQENNTTEDMMDDDESSLRRSTRRSTSLLTKGDSIEVIDAGENVESKGDEENESPESAENTETTETTGQDGRYPRRSSRVQKKVEEDEEDQKRETEENEVSEESVQSTEPENYIVTGKRNRKKPDRYEGRYEDRYTNKNTNKDEPWRSSRETRSTKGTLARGSKRKRARFEDQSSDDSSEDERRQPIKARSKTSTRDQQETNKRAANVRLTPGAPDLASLGNPSKAALSGDIAPVKVDQSCNFDTVGGHHQLKNQLKEMILLPLLYPEVFLKFAAKPPKGCLFIGPPGTGKTLLARALATECSKIQGQDVKVYVRNGADVLSKWVGESERQLRMLFEEAQKNAPAIIFFDEIDGLAPTRSSRQDHCHTSIVTTLLALLDGSSNRGDVVVIGATNRADVIDPALRRPGRFDREFHFTLPDEKTRLEIIKIHTKEWKPEPCEKLLSDLAKNSGGYCGADIANLCSEAAILGLRRTFPQIYNSQSQLLINDKMIKVTSQDFFDAMKKVTPAGQRMSNSSTIGACLPNHLTSLLETVSKDFHEFINKTVFPVEPKHNSSIILPPANSSMSLQKLCLSGTTNAIMFQPRLLLTGTNDFGQMHVANSFLHTTSSRNQNVRVVNLEACRLIENPIALLANAEQVAKSVSDESRTILYLGNIDELEDICGEDVILMLTLMLKRIPNFANTLVLGYSTTGKKLEENNMETSKIAILFKKHYNISAKNYQEHIESLLKQLIQDAISIPPPQDLSEIELKLPVLNSAPVKAKSIDPKVLEEKEQQEEYVMLTLRQFLRETLRDLIRDPRFRVFASPVDKEDVPDYYETVKTPMDLSLINEKIDTHQYQTARQFLQDIDLICSNALEYNPPDNDPRSIRPKACLLRDTAAQIMMEELDERFEKQCEKVMQDRIKRNATTTKNAPKYYYAGGKGVGYKCDGAGGGTLSETNSENDEDDAIVVNGSSENKAPAEIKVNPENNGELEKMDDLNIPNGKLTDEENGKNLHNSALFSPDENSMQSNPYNSALDLSNNNLSVHNLSTNIPTSESNMNSENISDFEILKTGSIEWMKCSKQVSQKFNSGRMKAIASATANDALRVGQVAWIDYSGEHFAAKITSVRLSSYHSVEYQVFCPSLPDHCKNDYVHASRICDFIDDGFVEKREKLKKKGGGNDKIGNKKKKNSPRKSAWASGKINRSSRNRTSSGKETAVISISSEPNKMSAEKNDDSQDSNQFLQSEPLNIDNNSMQNNNPVFNQTSNSSTSNQISNSIPFKSLNFNSNPLPERRVSNRIQTTNKNTSSNSKKVIVPEQACSEFLSDLVNQCVYRQLNLPQLEQLYSELSFVINEHKTEWDRTNCFKGMRDIAIAYFKQFDESS